MCSATRFGKISPFWQKFLSLLQNLDSLFLIWQNAEPTWAHLWHYWTNFHCCHRSNIEKQSKHLVTLCACLNDVNDTPPPFLPTLKACFSSHHSITAISRVCCRVLFKGNFKTNFHSNFFFSLSFSIHVKIAKTCFQFFHFWWLVSNLFHLFSSFTVNNVHPVYSAGIRTHNLWNTILLP